MLVNFSLYINCHTIKTNADMEIFLMTQLFDHQLKVHLCLIKNARVISYPRFKIGKYFAFYYLTNTLPKENWIMGFRKKCSDIENV